MRATRGKGVGEAKTDPPPLPGAAELADHSAAIAEPTVWNQTARTASTLRGVASVLRGCNAPRDRRRAAQLRGDAKALAMRPRGRGASGPGVKG